MILYRLEERDAGEVFVTWHARKDQVQRVARKSTAAEWSLHAVQVGTGREQLAALLNAHAIDYAMALEQPNELVDRGRNKP